MKETQEDINKRIDAEVAAGKTKESWESFDGETGQTRLQEDPGTGKAAIIRVFEFAANPVAFKEYKPSKQDLMNFHARSIEMQLWGDGLEVMSEVNPKITINKKKTKYRIIVGATPRKGHALMEKPQTVQEILHTK